MQRAALPDIDPDSIRAAVDPGSYARGVQYALQRAVAHLWWDEARGALHGSVRGSTGDFYATRVYFIACEVGGGRALEFEQGECTCPVGYNCKHAVALALTAAAENHDVGVDRPAAQAKPVSWSQSLDSLLGVDPATASDGQAGTALGIQLTLTPKQILPPARGLGLNATAAGPAAFKLSARLVQPGRTGAWVAGNLSWARLDSLGYHGGYLAAHVRLLQEMHAIYLARGSGLGYYGYGLDKTVDLCAFESRKLWPLLDEAASIGLALVYPGKLGAVQPYQHAELCLDVISRDPSGPLVITPVLRVDGARTLPRLAAFIGTEAHGLVYADPGGDGQRFVLARLTRDVPRQLQRMALAGHVLEIPAADRPAFSEQYYPRLRQMAAVISSDGSFTPPEISGPTLVLRASYGPGHDAEIGWDWAYQVGDTPFLAGLESGPSAAGYRDLPAERSLIATLSPTLERFGLLAPGFGPGAFGLARPLIPRARLAGLDTMRFSTELLPLLADQPGVKIEIDGDPPDYREAGDSLRIGVSADEVAGETDWFDLGVTIGVEGRRVPFSDVFLALSQGESHLLLDDGAYFSLQKPELQALAALIEEARALQDSPGGSLRISRFQAGLWAELAELGVVEHQANAWQEQVAGLLSARAIEPPAPPEALAGLLRPYQVDGFGWLAFLWRHRLGGILADDMGLGKTLQSLALICHARASDPSGAPFLIVAPTSVVPNWAAESARFTPGLTVATVSDTQARRGAPLEDCIVGADVVVTSYTLLRLEFDAYAARTWSGLILDEAQQAKNHQSRVYQCARRLPAPVKVAITGTPMENNLMELWSLLSITAPGLFPNPSRFRDYYARPIESGGDADLLAQLRRRIRPLVKRRTKEQVAADLPAKQEQVLEVELHPRHRKIYQTYLQRERQRVLGLISDMNANRFTILRSLTLLRQLSLHAGLVDDAHAGIPSAKIDTLAEQLHDVAGGGHRALVFSQFTGFLGRVRDRLEAEGLTCCYLDGRTRDRAAVIARFTGGAAPVFLISLKAGGFGLNLTEADYCFLLDPWWNPATEAQAVDRAHRIGQRSNVMVYRLIAADTIEQKVMALKARKAELFASVMDHGNVFGASLDAKDIRELIS